MNQSNLHLAIEQEETGAEKFLRDVLMKEGDCRFRVEVMLSDKKIRHYNLHSVSKPRAASEAQQFIGQMISTFEDDRVLWRVPGVTNWSMVSEKSLVNPEPIAKKESWWTRFIDKFFLIEED